MARTTIDLIHPDWPAPANVGAVASGRTGGVSQGQFESLNVGDHVGDAAESVARNRSALLAAADCTSQPRWLEQVHGSRVIQAGSPAGGAARVRADGCVARRRGQACIVMAADCLPVLFCDGAGSCVGAVHAGWRGLAAGILVAGVRAMRSAGSGNALLAWLGPAISAPQYEVGSDVRNAILESIPDAAGAFEPNARGCWQCDLVGIARGQLERLGVGVFGGDYCTASNPVQFFSHRRDGPCGRQAALVWLK